MPGKYVVLSEHTVDVNEVMMRDSTCTCKFDRYISYIIKTAYFSPDISLVVAVFRS